MCRIGPDAESRGVVVVVEDDPAVRDLLDLLLRVNGWTPAPYASAEALLAAGIPAGAVCAVVDVRLGSGIDGISLAERLAEGSAAAPVVVVTGHADVPLAVRAMRAGAVDVLEKPFDAGRLVRAVREAKRRAAHLSQAAEQARHAEEARRRLAALTPRERQVVRGLAEGKPNRLVALDLGISVRTVEVYRASVMEKLGTPSFADLVRMAILAGADPAEAAG